MKKQLLTLALLTGFSNAALAGGDCLSLGSDNFIQNCSFENVTGGIEEFRGVKNGADDGAPSAPVTGWLFDASNPLNSWANGSGATGSQAYAEVRDEGRGLGTTPFGDRFLELDTNAYLGAISQEVTGLTVGNTYTLTYYYSKGTGTDGTAQDFSASIFDPTSPLAIKTASHDAAFEPGTLTNGSYDWKSSTLVFDATRTNYNVVFADLGPVNSRGASIDNISLVTTAVAAVPEPETYAMFLMGLGLLGFAARKQKS